MPRERGEPFGLGFRARGRLRLDRIPVAQWSWTPHDPRRALLRPADAPALSPSAAQTNYRPSRRRQRVVLVLEAGVLSEGLIGALRRHRLKYFYLDYLELMERGRVQLGVASREAGALSLGPARLLLRDVAAVIWSQPLALASRISRRPAARHLFLHRWTQALRDLRGLLPAGVLWLPSHPLNGSSDWQDKLSELALARRLGLEVPETVYTNDPRAAARFVRRGRVLYKDLSQARIRFRTGFVGRRQQLAPLVNAPCGFQRYVDKHYDVRAVVVGDRVLACRIDSQASPSARVDWRVYDNARVRWSRMRLPRRVEGALRRMMKALDLTWASFDLVRGRDGAFYFLEVNRPGAVYWLLPFVGLDIPDEIAAFVKRRLAGR